MIVYLNDTPLGASDYEFRLRFHPIKSSDGPTKPTVKAHLRIAADIDGSDWVKITEKSATWEHKSWAYPRSVTLNGIEWDPEQVNVLANEAPHSYLPPGVNFLSAKIVARAGRDLATVWAEPDALWVFFADNTNGSDFYEVQVSFGH